MLQFPISFYNMLYSSFLQDPNGNRIKQFLGERDDFGVVTKSIVIDTHPVLGFWKINVTVPVSAKSNNKSLMTWVWWWVNKVCPYYDMYLLASIFLSIFSRYFQKRTRCKLCLKYMLNMFYCMILGSFLLTCPYWMHNSVPSTFPKNAHNRMIN